MVDTAITPREDARIGSAFVVVNDHDYDLFALRYSSASFVPNAGLRRRKIGVLHVASGRIVVKQRATPLFMLGGSLLLLLWTLLCVRSSWDAWRRLLARR